MRKFSRYQTRHSSKILPNTQNTKNGGKKKTKEDMDDEGKQDAGRELMKDNEQILILSMHCSNVFAFLLHNLFFAIFK